MHTNRFQAIFAGLMLSMCASLVQAQLNAQVEACRTIADRLERFDCYESLETGQAAETDADRAAETPAGSPDSEAAEQALAERGGLRRFLPFGRDEESREKERESPEPVTESAQARPSLQAGIASNTPDVGRRGDDSIDSIGQRNSATRIEADAQGQQILVARVAELRLIRDQQWQITLESGQVWRQVISKQFPLEVGLEVRIAPTRWGNNYRLTSPGINMGWIQVERAN